MEPVLLAFITGLTTGGLSCLAVQGGLLASSIASEVEQSVQKQSAPVQRVKPGTASQQLQVRAGRPILLFLTAKLVAYTLLGFVLGWVGSVFQLTPMMRAILLIAIGVFMVGNALRMLNVHPIFRYFALEPPSFVTRYIRRKSKDQSSALTPLFLGALTVLIPCGVTQAMMAVAMGDRESRGRRHDHVRLRPGDQPGVFHRRLSGYHASAPGWRRTSCGSWRSSCWSWG